MMSLKNETKFHEIIVDDFFKILSTFNNKVNPLIISDDVFMLKILSQLKNGEMSSKEIAKNLGWKFHNLGYVLNIFRKYGLCSWKIYEREKIWKLTKNGKQFLDAYKKISYPKSKFLLIIRVINNASIKEMASTLGFSVDHYERIERKGYPWSYKKACKIFQKLPKASNLERSSIVENLRKWALNKRINYIRNRGNKNKYNFLEKQSLSKSEKYVKKILEKFSLKSGKDFLIHKDVAGKNIDFVLKNGVCIEVVRSTNNIEKTVFMIENALGHLLTTVSNPNKRIVILAPGINHSIGLECLDLLKGKALVFFTEIPFIERRLELLETLTTLQTITNLQKRIGKPRETLRSQLKSLMKNNLVKRVDKYTWIISESGKRLLNLYSEFVVKNGNFLEPTSKMFSDNLELINTMIKFEFTRKQKIITPDKFTMKIINILKRSKIKSWSKPMKTKFHNKFPDIITRSNGKKYVIECVQTKKSSLYVQVIRLAYKIKLLKYYSNEKFIPLAIVSCSDQPLEFVPPNKPFKLLNEECEKIFIDSNIMDIISFLRNG